MDYAITATLGPVDGFRLRYTFERHEVTVEEARAVDLRTRAAWQGHPNLLIVDSSADFQAKIDGVLAATARALGIAIPSDVEGEPVPDAAS